MYRLVAADLDGTLLRDDKTISDKTIEELNRINNLGVIFLPSTGRTHRELPKVLMDLPFLRYALCCNGGSIYDYKEDKYIYENAIPYDMALEVLDYVKDLPVYESVVVKGRRLALGSEDGKVCEYVSEHAVKGILFNITGTPDIKKSFMEMNADAQKFLLYLENPNDKDEIMNNLKNRFPDLSIASSGPLFVEVNTKGVDKGKALVKLCELLNISIEDTIAFGDAENDLAMLDAAGIAVVMGNGTENTKAHADRICPSNNDDGMRITLEELIK